jgi:CelD/BcsL family acetyltransferase involved in cellulose biosynthesis
MLSVQFWRSEQELLANGDIWNALFLSSQASAYLSFEWVSTCWKFFSEGRTPLIGIVRNSDDPIALVPLELATEKIGPVSFRVLRFMLDDWGMETGVLTKEGINELQAIEAVLMASHRAGHHWDYARLGGYPASKLTSDQAGPSPRSPFHRVAKLTGPTVIIEIPTSWDEYKTTLSSSHRQTISRRVRALERKGRVRFERIGLTEVTDSPELNSLMKDAETVSQHSWQHKSTAGWAISNPESGGFFYEVSTRLASRGMLDLSVLYLDDQPISFIWGAARWPHLTIYKPGYDETLSDLAPGVVHLAKYIDDSIKRRARDVDYGPAFFDYKSSWGKKYIDLCSLYYYPKKLKPTLLRLLRSKRHSRYVVEPHAASSRFTREGPSLP